MIPIILFNLSDTPCHEAKYEVGSSQPLSHMESINGKKAKKFWIEYT